MSAAKYLIFPKKEKLSKIASASREKSRCEKKNSFSSLAKEKALIMIASRCYERKDRRLGNDC